jgi:molybdate transport system substrate-binding protein
MKIFPVLKFRRRARQILLVLPISLMVSLQPLTAAADQALVAVASNFISCARILVTTFEESSAHSLTLTFASTGQLHAQVMHGAPYDLFLAADQERPRRLVESGRAVPGSRFTYAQGALVLAQRDLSDDDLGGAQRLRDGDFARLAMANPTLAPYGQAAMETLAGLGVVASLQDRIVLGENVGQAFAMLATGNVEVALVAESQLLESQLSESPMPLATWRVPAELHTPIRQDLVLLRHGEHNAAARAFHGFLQTDQAAEIITRQGYRVAVD